MVWAVAARPDVPFPSSTVNHESIFAVAVSGCGGRRARGDASPTPLPLPLPLRCRERRAEEWEEVSDREPRYLTRSRADIVTDSAWVHSSNVCVQRGLHWRLQGETNRRARISQPCSEPAQMVAAETPTKRLSSSPMVLAIASVSRRACDSASLNQAGTRVEVCGHDPRRFRDDVLRSSDRRTRVDVGETPFCAEYCLRSEHVDSVCVATRGS